ncbi:hypothetical protein SAMN05216490_0057 [Mucilaginibacter mallensis]|uniref:Uncharacterized protein n=1 Tax=Mucilaginibacter mallensis TaxID=652787 RepID=A0A1H1MEE4_MUCMA|nr:hypothetical protein SAMN05216490_0057 [Mucilaginibacter mallensis]
MVSLIAAKAYFFCLDTKETKNQDKKILPPTGKTPRPALFVRPLPAFHYGSINALIFGEGWVN